MMCISSSIFAQTFPTVDYELIKYDNGFPYQSGYQEIPGDQVALKITPTKYPFKIQEVHINFVAFSCLSNITDPIIYRILDDNGDGNKPGDVLLDDQTITCKGDEYLTCLYKCNYWHKIDLSDKNIVIQDGSFFVSLKWITSESPAVGIDTQDPNEYRTWVYEGGSWKLLSEAYPGFANNQLMVRVLGGIFNNSKIKTISYDDGFPDGSNWQQFVGDKIAVRFTPTAFPCKLIGSFINITNYSGNAMDPLILEVYRNNNGPSDLIFSKEVKNTDYPTANGNTWIFIDLSTENIVINEDDFFISLKWLVSSSPAVGIDQENNNININRMWIYENSEWTLLTQKYPQVTDDLMMVTALCQYNPPSPPISLNADNILHSSFRANWNASPTASGYYLDVATDMGFSNLVSGYNKKDVGLSFNWNVTGLNALTTYYYRVFAYNFGGVSPSSGIITLKTLTEPSSVPQGLNALSCNNLMMLSWEESTGSHFQKYNIYGGTSPNPTSVVSTATNGINDTSKTFSGLPRGATYYYRVTSVNHDGSESNFSNEASATVKTGVIPKIYIKWDDVLICSNLGDSIKTFQWYEGSSIISGAVNQFYQTNKIPAIYKVLTTDYDGCANYSNEISLSGLKSLSIYPNPVRNEFTLCFSDDSYGFVDVKLINSLGSIVREYKTEKTGTLLFQHVPVDNLPSGLYRVHLTILGLEYFSSIIIL